MAVLDFARDGSGQVEPARHDRDLLRVCARGGFALVRVDEGTKTLHVSRILANEPLRRAIRLL